jgi:Asp/Glu/hydantoin racemase
MIGIMMLDTKFPRLIGDIGNPASFLQPTLYRYIAGASVDKVVSDKPVTGKVLRRFIETAIHLEHDGATVLGTSCGFLSSVQKEIESAVKIPFLSSSLILVPLLQSMFGKNTRIGVLTFDDSKLGVSHFGGEPDQNISIHGLPAVSSYRQTIATDGKHIDQQAAGQEVMNTAQRCIELQPDTGVFLIECTNLSPWKRQIKSEFGLPVFDLVDALEWIDKATLATQRPDIAEGK